jgi:hypothetical protein
MRTVVWSQDYVNKQTHYQTHTPIQGLWYFEVLWYIATYIQISPYGGPNLPSPPIGVTPLQKRPGAPLGQDSKSSEVPPNVRGFSTHAGRFEDNRRGITRKIVQRLRDSTILIG